MSVIEKKVTKYFIKCEDCGKEFEILDPKNIELAKCSDCFAKFMCSQDEKDFEKVTAKFVGAKIISLQRKTDNSVNNIVIRTVDGDEYRVVPDYYGDCTPLEFEYLRNNKND